MNEEDLDQAIEWWEETCRLKTAEIARMRALIVGMVKSTFEEQYNGHRIEILAVFSPDRIEYYMVFIDGEYRISKKYLLEALQAGRAEIDQAKPAE